MSRLTDLEADYDAAIARFAKFRADVLEAIGVEDFYGGGGSGEATTLFDNEIIQALRNALARARREPTP